MVMPSNKDNQPPSNHSYVTALVAAESHGRTGDVFAPPYEPSWATPADHTVEDDTYDWKHQAPTAPPPELHFDVREARTVEWAWWGIALQLTLIPAWLITLALYLIADYKWGALIMATPLLIISSAGLANSIRSLIHLRRAPQPLLVLCLGLIGLALGLGFVLLFAPGLINGTTYPPGWSMRPTR